MIEVLELKAWFYKVRRSNRKGYYDLVVRKDGSIWCSCPSFKYNNPECKHIEALEQIRDDYADTLEESLHVV